MNCSGIVKVRVLQLIDSLAIGGLERVAVNLANRLPRERFDCELCCSRTEGPLAALVSSDVTQFCLQRRHRFDIKAIFQLHHYIQTRQIQVLHAHGSSLFLAVVAQMGANMPRIIWHDHFGDNEAEPRTECLYKLATSRVNAVISVTEALAQWSRDRLRIPMKRVRYIPNFASPPPASSLDDPLPGVPGLRLVCVANFRPQKDHLNVLRALKMIRNEFPKIHLLLVGSEDDSEQCERITSEISRLGLESNVSRLGVRLDVAAIVRSCDVGVLGSRSEGMPLVLVEYGLVGLPSVATDVGQCREVLDGGRVGVLVPSSDPVALADGILRTLKVDDAKERWGEPFRQWVTAKFGVDAIIGQVCEVYEEVMRESSSTRTNVL